MRVGAVCRGEVEVADGGWEVREAAAVMRGRHVGALVVVDGQRRPIGILTDRDLALRVLAEGRDPIATRVADVMSRRPVTVSKSARIEAAIALMSSRAHSFRRLPVVDRTGRLVGVVTLDDVLARAAELLGSVDGVLRRQTPFVSDGFLPGEGRAGAAVKPRTPGNRAARPRPRGTAPARGAIRSDTR
jgi:CBS-domain-containing membrane protein